MNALKDFIGLLLYMATWFLGAVTLAVALGAFFGLVVRTARMVYL